MAALRHGVVEILVRARDARTLTVVRQDLSPLFEAIKARDSSAGSAAINPRVLFALWLYAVFDGKACPLTAGSTLLDRNAPEVHHRGCTAFTENRRYH